MKTLLALLMLTLASTARAQDPQWYQIEILVFESTDPAAYTSEAWRGTAEPDVENDGPVPGAAAPLRALPPDRLRLLAEAKRKLADSGRYRPQLHTGWVQAAGTDVGRPVRLSASSARGESVEGVAKVDGGKSPHIELDVVFKRPTGVPPVQVRLHGDRRLRLRELNYFDHPALGALVFISPYTPPAAR